MHKTIIGDVEITSDGETVWVNGLEGCIGRFGPYGFDVGRFTDRPHWGRFAEALLQRHGITIPDSHKPKFLAAAEVA